MIAALILLLCSLVSAKCGSYCDTTPCDPTGSCPICDINNTVKCVAKNARCGQVCSGQDLCLSVGDCPICGNGYCVPSNSTCGDSCSTVPCNPMGSCSVCDTMTQRCIAKNDVCGASCSEGNPCANPTCTMCDITTNKCLPYSSGCGSRCSYSVPCNTSSICNKCNATGFCVKPEPVCGSDCSQFPCNPNGKCSVCNQGSSSSASGSNSGVEPVNTCVPPDYGCGFPCNIDYENADCVQSSVCTVCTGSDTGVYTCAAP